MVRPGTDVRIAEDWNAHNKRDFNANSFKDDVIRN